MPIYHSASGSCAEDLFIELFSDAFGAEKAGYLYSQYHFYDIYQNSRFADFVVNTGFKRVAIEVDDEASHNKNIIAENKFYDHLLKQNSMVHLGWDVYRFAVRQMQSQPDRIKDELRVFLGTYPQFKEIEDYLPPQRAKAVDAVNLELKEHQKAALKALNEMRSNSETIGLLYHATGTGKTVTAVMDAKNCGGRTLFLAHTVELVEQAADTFGKLWSKATVGKYVDSIKQPNAHVVCGSIQSVALNLDKFKDNDFDYLIIDEAHHTSADTYQKVLSYFKPKFTLGLTATPERTDDNTVILDIFKKTAHKLDIQTAVEIGELVPVRCIRIHTNIDLTKVRFNSVQYNIRDLESKIYVPERNKLIVDTWLNYVKNKRTVIFCASVKHAEEIASLFIAENIKAVAVSGNMKASERKEHLEKFAEGEIKVLCACDLLNEGWDCPETEVLFMARPTMSKVLYTQQLGRGMRLAENKDSLMVFDFVDNASQYNMPQSLHRLFRLKDYRAGALALAPQVQKTAEDGLYAKGERPDALIDWPVDATDYEIVNIFNWQEEAAGMISQMEFVRRVDVQTETIERYVREGKLIPDLIVPMSEHRTFKYFKEETLERYATQYGWTIIDDKNRKDLFMDMVRQMDMSYSYKPVLLKAIMLYADEKGRIKLSDIVSYFREFYESRRQNGFVVEKKNSIFAKGGYTDKEAERNILSNPFKRFEDMNMLRHTKTLGIVEIDSTIWKNLSNEDKAEIEGACEEKLNGYYARMK
ncbi:DEAD/DEAH box helicase [Paludicola sp. MB14-C6]|uniref:DEAD/DEAH box helicase n=1 Tax=Paludihabitans sp. MB14-C6 TaxID=3070656 RepID=UPI0027DC6EA7|nr:DEAD/DEAH box helicase [Paludicola sp. MB14-C6]WMJ23201.1 DEAD/DEAH box helicase [Paludicola sp. MB14-C6]